VKLVRKDRYPLGQQQDKLKFNSASINTPLSKSEQSSENMIAEDLRNFYSKFA